MSSILLKPESQIRVAMTMNRGRNPDQQDAMWVGGQVHQHADLPTRGFECDADALFAIADGVAASPTPARASLLAVKALAREMKLHADDWSFDGLIGTRHVRAAQNALCEALAARRLLCGASTTLVAVHLRGGRLAVVNSGDSRAYLIRANSETLRLSKDHTELQLLIDSGDAKMGVEYASIYDALSDCLVADPEAESFAVHREPCLRRPHRHVYVSFHYTP